MQIRKSLITPSAGSASNCNIASLTLNLPFVYANESLTARQSQYIGSATTAVVTWEYRDAANNEVEYTDSSGDVVSGDVYSGRYDALGRMTGSPLFLNPPQNQRQLSKFYDVPEQLGSGGCHVVVDGVQEECGHQSSSAVAYCPNNYCGPRPGKGKDGKPILTEPWESHADGTNGWKLPQGKVRRGPDSSTVDLDNTVVNINAGDLWLEAEVPDDSKKYNDCANAAWGNIRGGYEPGYNQAKMIQHVSADGVSETLLAVTWRLEGGTTGTEFSMKPNNNGNDGSAGNVDIGPGQINYKTFATSQVLAGMDLKLVFGTNLAGAQPFDGDADSNLHAVANILRSYGGSDRNRAGKYRSGDGEWAKSGAGRKAYESRAKNYDSLKSGYDRFFNCFR